MRNLTDPSRWFLYSFSNVETKETGRRGVVLVFDLGSEVREDDDVVVGDGAVLRVLEGEERLHGLLLCLAELASELREGAGLLSGK